MIITKVYRRMYPFGVILLMLICCCCSNAKPKLPALYLKQKEINLGAIKRDSAIHTFSFTIKNTGSVPLLIKEISTSCPCAEVDYADNSIKPGKESSFNVLLDVSKMALQEFFVREIYIQSNAPEVNDTILLKGAIIK